MKFVRTVGIVVGVVALVATGAGLALGGAAVGAAAAGGSAALGATLTSVGTIASVAAGLISVGTAVFARKPGFSQEGSATTFQTNPQSGLPYAIGRTRMSGLRIHAETYDATAYKSEGRDDVLSFAVMLSAGGAIQQIETFRADKEVITFDPATGMANGAHAGFMAQKVSLGLAGASALALAFGGGSVPGWTANHKLSGISHALWDIRHDAEGEHFAAGIPVPEWIGKWVKVYDPRKDSTYPGGSGSHRALDEGTYEWSACPYLHALTWALGRWQNGKRTLGIGAPIENIRVADFVQGANVADANGWKVGGVEWSTDSKWTTMKRMLQAGGGEPTMTGAMIGCLVNMPRVSVATITADKLHDNFSISTTRSRRDRFNTVIPRYRSEDHDWEVISGAPVSIPLYVTEDGGPRTKEIDFPLVQHERDTNGNKQAGELAAYEIVNSREAGPIRFTVGPEYLGVKTGDCVTLDIPAEGIPAQKVIIRRKVPDAGTFKFTFEAETETDEKHDFALGRTTIPPSTWSPTPPDLTPPLPNAALWSLTAERTGGFVPTLRISGANEFPGADLVLIEYRLVGGTWVAAGSGSYDASTPVDFTDDTVAPATAYEARVSYKSGSRYGPWLTLAPVTTPTVPTPTVAHWTLTPQLTGAVLPGLRMRGTPEFPGVELAIVEYVEDGTLTWFSAGTFPAAQAVDHIVNSVKANTSYRARVAYQTKNLKSPWLLFGPVVTPTFDLVDSVDGLETNFNARNDRDPTGPIRPSVVTTGSARAVEHTNNDNGTIDVSFEWDYTFLDEDKNDGFEVEIYWSTDAAAYTPGSNTGSLVVLVPVNRRAFVLQGAPSAVAGAPLNYTFAVRAYREVDDDVWDTWAGVSPTLYTTTSRGRIVSSWRKSTRAIEDPYNPVLQKPATGDILSTIAGRSATTVATTINADGTIAGGKVVEESIDPSAINVAITARQSGNFTAPEGAIVQRFMTLATPIAGHRVVAEFTFNFEILVTNPTPPTRYYFALNIYCAKPGGPNVFMQPQISEGSTWRSAALVATDEKVMEGARTFQGVFDGLPPGNYEFGFYLQVPASNKVRITGERAMRITDMRAAN